MMITLDIGRKLVCRLPYPGAKHVVPVDGTMCDGCGQTIAARMPRPEMQHDRYIGRAFCVNDGCDAELGIMTVVLETIFGIEEDRRVLVDGRARVY